MPTLILIRHADNDYIGKRLAGHLPGVHLNAHGRQQAGQLALKLAALPISAVYSSPLERAIETAEPIAQSKSLSVTILPALTEINTGDWQGKCLPVLRRHKLWRKIHEQPASFSFPNGEGFLEKQMLMCDALKELIHGAAKQDVLVCVSHGDPIKLSLAYFLSMDINDFQRIVIDPASASFIYFSKNHVHLGPINLVEEVPLKRI